MLAKIIAVLVFLILIVQFARAFNFWVQAHHRDGEKPKAEEAPGDYAWDLRKQLN